MRSVNNIKALIYSIKNNDVEKINLEQQNNKIIINKIRKQSIYTAVKGKINSHNHGNSISYEKINETINKDHPQVNAKHTEQSVKYSTIISPMVGNFYRSPAPNEPAFIELNQSVKPKQTVCIIEAMKLMNEIESEVQGEIVEILVKDGDIVDCGQALMKVRIK